MSVAALSVALWLGTVGFAGGVVLGYRLRRAEERRG